MSSSPIRSVLTQLPDAASLVEVLKLVPDPRARRGIRHATGQLEVGPKNDVLLNEGDIIMVMAEERDIAALNARGSSR